MLKKLLSKLFRKSAEAAPREKPVIELNPYGYESEQEFIDEIKSKLAAGANPDDFTTHDHPLNAACHKGYKQAAELLMAAGADVNATLNGGRTPFHHAAASASLEIMKLLIEKGADPHAKTKQGNDALYEFIHWPTDSAEKRPDVAQRATECLQFLTGLGMTLDHYAMSTIYTRRKYLIPQVPELVPVQEFENIVKAQDLPKLKEWLGRGTPADYGVEYGAASAMCVAAENNNIEMMDMLLEHGGSVESGSGGMTPIMAATYAGAKETFMMLLRHGADTTKLFTYDRYPDTTLPELADLGKHEGMRAFVEQALAHRDDPIPEPDVAVNHKVVLEKPLQLKPAASPQFR